MKGKEWKWDEWMNILKLGVEHWRMPIILTNLAQQPWATGRIIDAKNTDCPAELTTHTCRLANLDKPHHVQKRLSPKRKSSICM